MGASLTARVREEAEAARLTETWSKAARRPALRSPTQPTAAAPRSLNSPSGIGQPPLGLHFGLPRLYLGPFILYPARPPFLLYGSSAAEATAAIRFA